MLGQSTLGFGNYFCLFFLILKEIAFTIFDNSRTTVSVDV